MKTKQMLVNDMAQQVIDAQKIAARRSKEVREQLKQAIECQMFDEIHKLTDEWYMLTAFSEECWKKLELLHSIPID